MGLRISLKVLPLMVGLFFLAGSTGRGEGPATQPSPGGTDISSPQVTPWTLAQKKSLQNYNVEIFQRMTVAKFPRIEAMKAKITPKSGGAPTEIEGTWLSIDLKNFLIGWKGGLLDVDGDGIEDLILQNYSGGGHCCYNYLIYSLKNPMKKLGDLPMKDCGEKIGLEDLNGDKTLELIACNPDFTYLGEVPYSESPFPPAIYALKGGEYQRADLDFRQVFQSDIQAQREALAKAYRPACVLQIVTDYLLLGDSATAWKEMDTLYKGADKDALKVELAKRLGIQSPVGDASLSK